MAKASERKGVRKDERECCLAERKKQLVKPRHLHTLIRHRALSLG